MILCSCATLLHPVLPQKNCHEGVGMLHTFGDAAGAGDAGDGRNALDEVARALLHAQARGSRGCIDLSGRLHQPAEQQRQLGTLAAHGSQAHASYSKATVEMLVAAVAASIPADVFTSLLQPAGKQRRLSVLVLHGKEARTAILQASARAPLSLGHNLREDKAGERRRSERKPD